jgi:hypothetical protein
VHPKSKKGAHTMTSNPNFNMAYLAETFISTNSTNVTRFFFQYRVTIAKSLEIYTQGSHRTVVNTLG